ncbi:MAG TPA: sugar ABC transporter permease [Halanaerobiales bacterium]|nr:sugar ABC transporter permease [Halanaerobiales bacterium]
MRLNKKIAPYVFISPFYILFFIFGAFPILFSLYLSFHKWDGIREMEYVGVENYTFTLTDPWFWASVRNTVDIFLKTTIPQHLIALLFAFVLAAGVVKFREFFRTVFFMPYITSAVAVTIIFGIVFGQQYGIVNAIIRSLQNIIPFSNIFNLFDMTYPVRWTGSERWINWTIANLVTWQFTGFNIIIYYAGLKKIPTNVYEAARIDGATTMQTFFKITLPLLRPIIFFAVTMSIIGNLQLFDQPMVLVGGQGPNLSGMTTAVYLYRTGFEWNEFGTGSAIAYILCSFIILLSYLNNRFFNTKT